MNRYHFPSRTVPMPCRQRGVTLIVALIFLVILALLGVTAARNSVMEERMAGNTRDRDLAFQAAEAGLRKFETDTNPPTGFVAPSGTGYYDRSNCAVPTSPSCYLSHPNGNDDYWNNPAQIAQANGQWTAAVSKAGPDVAQLDIDPRYIVEKLPDAGTKQRFRVTSRGVGKASATVVILQAEYEY
jgi:type IV pilus assembly protein PilX